MVKYVFFAMSKQGIDQLILIILREIDFLLKIYW